MLPKNRSDGQARNLGNFAGLNRIACTLLIAALIFTGAACRKGPPPTRAEKKELLIIAADPPFSGDAVKAAAQKFHEQSGVKVELRSSDKADQDIQSAILQKNAPDVALVSRSFDTWKMIEQGQLTDLRSSLKEPYDNTHTPWRSAFFPETLDLGNYENHQYLVPIGMFVTGWWHDARLFEENNWQTPRTYQDLLVLCQRISAAGIAPITYPGQYPANLINGMLAPWIVSFGGSEAFEACQSLKPGAWNSPAVLRAATMIRELRDMGYLQAGANGMNPDEAFAELSKQRAAFLVIGSDFRFAGDGEPAFARPPVIGDGKGDPDSVLLTSELAFVPKGAENPAAGIAFLRFLTTETTLNPFGNPIRPIAPTTSPLKFTPLVAVAQSQHRLVDSWRIRYPRLYDAVGAALRELLEGRLSPAEFTDRCEQQAKLIRLSQK